jgi:hypothetical protein
VLEQLGLAVDDGQVLGEGRNVAGLVYERVLHVTAQVGARIGYERHASARHGLGAHEAESLLEAREKKNVARSHEVGHIGAMAEDPDAWIRERTFE